MTALAKKVSLSGSHRNPVPGSHAIGPIHPEERIEVTVRLRPRATIAGDAKLQTQLAQAPRHRVYLTHDQMAANHGTTPEDIAKVVAFATAHNLAVVSTSAARRSVWLTGTAADLEAAFGITLQEYDHPEGGTFRSHTEPIHIPSNLEGIVVGIFGLDNRPQARPHFRMGTSRRKKSGPKGDQTQFTPPQVAALYDFPAKVTGSGQCIGIIELGGGYKTADLKTYFSGLGLKAPKISSVSVDQGKNAPTGSANGPEGEVMLDIEVAASVAPGATIVVYFCPNTDKGFLDAVTQAVHDTTNKPSVISISWGGPESTWSAQAMEQFDEAFQAAAALGITVCVACGDNGSSDGVDDGLAHVDFPASSPNVLGCGGTTLDVETGSTTISNEVVWNDGADGGATGGGVSDQFPLPSYQQDAGVPPSANPGGHVGRGLPDVAADADPDTGYTVRVDGTDTVIGGTSAVAPLWAALVALLNQSLGHPVGFLNPTLYGPDARSGIFRDITSGTNGAYSAKPGWDACSGLGSVDGAKLLAALGQPSAQKA
ncbi:MAG: protease pro-enzyme activation domain-containing protein [Isosphaeraceae bacterium]